MFPCHPHASSRGTPCRRMLKNVEQCSSRARRGVGLPLQTPGCRPPVLNRTWALDFMTETLYDGGRLRLLAESR